MWRKTVSFTTLLVQVLIAAAANVDTDANRNLAETDILKFKTKHSFGKDFNVIFAYSSGIKKGTHPYMGIYKFDEDHDLDDMSYIPDDEYLHSYLETCGEQTYEGCDPKLKRGLLEFAARGPKSYWNGDFPLPPDDYKVCFVNEVHNPGYKFDYLHGEHALLCSMYGNGDPDDQAPSSEFGMGFSKKKCQRTALFYGYFYVNWWAEDGRCRGLHSCPYAYDCTKYECSDYDQTVQTFRNLYDEYDYNLVTDCEKFTVEMKKEDLIEKSTITPLKDSFISGEAINGRFRFPQAMGNTWVGLYRAQYDGTKPPHGNLACNSLLWTYTGCNNQKGDQEESENCAFKKKTGFITLDQQNWDYDCFDCDEDVWPPPPGNYYLCISWLNEDPLDLFKCSEMFAILPDPDAEEDDGTHSGDGGDGSESTLS